MNKIGRLLLAILFAYFVTVNFIENTDLSKSFGIPVNNWIYRLGFIAISLINFFEYYKANWGKSKKSQS